VHQLLVHLVKVASVAVGQPGVVDERAHVEASDGVLERLRTGREPLAGKGKTQHGLAGVRVCEISVHCKVPSMGYLFKQLNHL